MYYIKYAVYYMIYIIYIYALTLLVGPHTHPQMVSDEGSQGEILRQVLNVEGMIEGGCTELLDKDQALIKQGVCKGIYSH